MKNIFKNKTKQNTGFFTLSLLTLLIFVISCEIPQSAGEILEIRVETNIFSHKTFITINDLADQNNLNGKVLKAKITVLNDNTPNLIVSEGGEFGDTIDIVDGLAAFAVNPSYRNFTNPIDLQVVVFGNGFLTKTVSLTINPKDFTTEINETVLKISNVPDGVGVKIQTETLSGGSNTNVISASTDASSDGTSADVNIPADNVFKDVSGNDINSGDLILQAVYFDGSNDEASRASNNSNIGSLLDENGETSTNVVLAPLATVDVNMSVGGVEVKEFDIPIEIIMDVNEEMINPNTGVKVAVGDEINIYSTSDDSNWSYLGKEAIKSEGGQLYISFSTNHLSTFSAASKSDTCPDNAIIKLPNGGNGFATVYNGKFITSQGAIYPTVGVKNGDLLSLTNAPLGNASLVLVTSAGNSVTIEDLTWCNGGTPIEGVNVDGLLVPGVTVNLNISARCSSTSSIVPNEVKVFVDYNGNGVYTSVGLIKNGKISIPGIVLGQTYEMKVVYDGQSGFGSYTFSSENEDILDYDLPGDVCAELNL